MKNLKIYFMGIGGVSMNALAKLCVHLGADVSGSDDNAETDFSNLTKLGVECSVGANRKKIQECDIFVYTIAVGVACKEVIFAKNEGKKVFERAEFLGEIEKYFSHSLAISGTHGKTTTTAMLGNIFKKANKKPTVHVGGDSMDLGGNLLLGKTEYFITEACEFNKSLLHLKPESCIITNIECDHMDTYKNLDDIYETFEKFASQTRKYVVLNGDLVNKNLINTKAKIITFGLKKSNDFYATNIKQKNGKFTFDVYNNSNFLGTIKLNVLGEHNILNALACLALCYQYNIDYNDIVAGIKGYSGVKRRLSCVKLNKDFAVYHDYAHHPTEIKTTLKTLRLICANKLIVIFQPHTYTRTKALMSDFCTCFDECDFLYILPTYPAREDYLMGGDALDLFYNLNGRKNCSYCTNIVSLEYELNNQLNKGDLVVFIGAGDIINWVNQFKQDNI